MALDILGQGWNISQKGVEIITENNTINDKSTLLRNALNSDLKETGSPVLAKILNKNNVTQVVLQIQKIRNISAPKANENSQAAPRMLKLVLTDGDTYIQAIETAPVPVINRDKTPPGSKLLIHSAKISSGYLLLEASSCSLLGGRVPTLYEKWELAKSVQHHNRQNGEIYFKKYRCLNGLVKKLNIWSVQDVRLRLVELGKKYKQLIKIKNCVPVLILLGLTSADF